MSLSDPDGNKPGGRNIYGKYTYERYLPSQGLTRAEKTMQLAARNRSGNTTSVPILLAGTSTMWRKPTSFSRNIIKHTPTPYSQYWVSGSHKGGYLHSMTSDIVGNNPKLHEFLPLFPSGGYTQPEYDYNDRARAITECLVKIGDGKANLAESLVTYKQTVDLLATTASSLFKLLLAVKRGQWGSLPKMFRSPSQGGARKWLEWQYGWKPLCGDIHAIYSELQSIGLPPALLITARRTIRGDLSYESVSSGFESRTLNWNTRSRYSTICSLTGKLQDAWLRRGTQFGLGNPAALGWELVPYSFVVDWVLPVGNVLQAFTAPAGLDFVSGYTSAHIEGHKVINISGPAVSVLTGGASTYTVDRFGFRRDPLLNWPLPLPYVKSPLSTPHTLNALALLRQLLR